MKNFEKFITEDGSISFYNNIYGDIYHSRQGAYTEALEKFVRPLNLLEALGNYSDINVLDVCYGSGYNSKVLLSEIIQRMPGKKINVTAIEIDPYIIAESVEIDFPGYSDRLKAFFNSVLHKVYYTTSFDPENMNGVFEVTDEALRLKLFIDEARKIIAQLDSTYDLILHDPFSPQKQPELWTLDLFRHYYRLLSNNGQFITYSSAYSIRGGLQEAGFFLGNTQPIARSQPGTIAAKRIEQIQYPLTKKQKSIISSKAGIPFEDPELCLSSKEIFLKREEQQRQSNRISSTQARRN
jgi:tRNA U34 5-methylaminomethyl-2-thiouridine-forming methyltransferase MnmC